jgi:hypothetical protein
MRARIRFQPDCFSDGLRTVGEEEATDASRVFFRTAEALVPDDTNTTPNVYERFDGQTYLVPAVPGGGGAQQLAGLTPDGRTVLWYTTDALVPSNTDTASDLYAATFPNRPPDCSGVAASRPVLRTAHHMLVAITLDGATDPDGMRSRSRSTA